ncbi:hypothetical protein LCGC14_2483430 [marine sediment metagenome]|uniref:Uncharacterized protein n=1 Tax=marine sediment metagenome TaxID=412755 RepID=A0A0F9BUN1_9ZZZZ
MNVTTVPESKPEVAITASWEEARILCGVFGGIKGPVYNKNRECTDALYKELSDLLVHNAYKGIFTGRFL